MPLRADAGSDMLYVYRRLGPKGLAASIRTREGSSLEESGPERTCRSYEDAGSLSIRGCGSLRGSATVILSDD